MRSGPLFLTAILLATPVLAQTSGSHDGMAMGTPPAGASMADSMNTMNHAMASVPMTGDPDRDFVAAMIPHHQGAIDMARYELQHGKDPELRQLARNIVAAQDKEIAFMKRWMAKHPAQAPKP